MSSEELDAIVGVESQQRKRQVRSHANDGLEHGELAAIADGETFGPAGADIGGGQGIEVVAFDGATRMSDQINFQKSRLNVIPVSKGANGNDIGKQGARLGGGKPSKPSAMPFLLQEPISGGRTESQELRLGGGIQTQFPHAFEDADQLGQVGDEPLTTDAIGGSPTANEGLLDGEKSSAVVAGVSWEETLC